MPKAKTLVPRGKKKGKGGLDPPTDPDTYLAQAVANEESAEKWRAGDAIKSARFYARALEVYESGIRSLTAHTPDSKYDLFYNRARVLYTISQSAALLKVWAPVVESFPALEEKEGSVQGVLQAALAAHRRALEIRPKESDALFNYAMVLSSLSDENNQDTQSLLEQSAQVLVECLALQEESYQASKGLVEEWSSETHDLSQGAQNEDQESEGSEAEAQWASVQEPVTATTLVDTIISTLEVLGALVDGAEDNETVLAGAETLGEKLINEKLTLYADSTNINATIAANGFKASLLEAAFRFLKIDAGTYATGLKNLYEVEGKADLTGNPEWQVAYADALADCAITLGEANPTEQTPTQRWTRLSKALELLSLASKSPTVQDAARVHLGRGDMELLRWGVAQAGGLAESLGNTGVQATLLKNAGTFYRGAVNTAKARLRGLNSADVAADKETVGRGLVREWVASVLAGAESKRNGAPDIEVDWAGEVRRMEDESVLNGAMIETLLGLL